MRCSASIALLALAGWTSARHPSLASRDIVQKGGWSLSVPTGSGCPAMTSSCFTNQTGNFKTPARGENCCPTVPLDYSNEYGQQVQTPLYCGTYVNTGQPYACCPLGNADCRGDVGAFNTTQKCANSGWAQWRVPDGGFNHFCCLPGQYGYWLPARGQDAVGQCSVSNVLPRGAQPAEQLDNGDGSVAPDGTQLAPIPSAVPTPAPVCDIVANYGWSLQVDTADQCTAGSKLCDYGIGCCPNSLNCGTVIGASEVPVCCPPDNPDCRGAVEGLAVQLCADSSWALWHVNTNGNHFCCRAGQVGFNVPNDQGATGFCGDVVPAGTMRSILDYPGDGSTPGSSEAFPCDTDPRPEYGLSSIVSSILGSPTTAPSAAAGNVIGLAPSQYLNTSAPVYTTTVTTCPGDSTNTLTYQVQGIITSGTRVPLASNIVIAPSEHAEIVSAVLATAYSYTQTYTPLPSTVADTTTAVPASATSASPAANGNGKAQGGAQGNPVTGASLTGLLQTNSASGLDGLGFSLLLVLASAIGAISL